MDGKLVMTFGGRGTPRPIPNKNSWATKVVSVVAEGDYVTVAVVRECADPRTPGKTYTTTWFDMWRFVDGKADEHWDFGTVAGPGNPPDCARAGAGAARPPEVEDNASNNGDKPRITRITRMNLKSASG